MAEVKLVVIYPRPKDVAAFEKIYQTEHVPLAVARLGGKTKIVPTKIRQLSFMSKLGHCFLPPTRSQPAFSWRLRITATNRR